MTNEFKKIKEMLDKDILIEGQTRDTVKKLIDYIAILEKRLTKLESNFNTLTYNRFKK